MAVANQSLIIYDASHAHYITEEKETSFNIMKSEQKGSH